MFSGIWRPIPKILGNNLHLAFYKDFIRNKCFINSFSPFKEQCVTKTWDFLWPRDTAEGNGKGNGAGSTFCYHRLRPGAHDTQVLMIQFNPLTSGPGFPSADSIAQSRSQSRQLCSEGYIITQLCVQLTLRAAAGPQSLVAPTQLGKPIPERGS